MERAKSFALISGLGQARLWSLEETSLVPCNKPLGSYGYSRWQQKSHMRHETPKTVSHDGDRCSLSVSMRKHSLCFTETSRSLPYRMWNSPSLCLDKIVAHSHSHSLLFLFFSISLQTPFKETLPQPNCPTSRHISHCGRVLVLTEAWPKVSLLLREYVHVLSVSWQRPYLKCNCSCQNMSLSYPCLDRGLTYSVDYPARMCPCLKRAPTETWPTVWILMPE